MRKRRQLHTATLLADGTVLITGGYTYNPDEHHSTAEIYDPATDTFGSTGSMSRPHYFHSATRLADGRVLLDGGTGPSPPAPSEVYDPVARTFAQTGAPSTIRNYSSATLLNDGRVLFAGTYSSDGDSAAAEVYDPGTGLYSALPNLSVPRGFHASTLLLDGRVLVAGTRGACPVACSTESFDPATQTFSPGPAMSIGRSSHTATLLNDGSVLVVGGQEDGDTATAELFDPITNTFVAAGAMVGRSWFGHTATLLSDGSVLIVGSVGPVGGRGAELYMPAPITPLSLTVTPSVATMQAGESRTFTVVDQLGHPRIDAAWSVDNVGVATVDPVTGVVGCRKQRRCRPHGRSGIRHGDRGNCRGTCGLAAQRNSALVHSYADWVDVDASRGGRGRWPGILLHQHRRSRHTTTGLIARWATAVAHLAARCRERGGA
jgi:hypothetical protein